MKIYLCIVGIFLVLVQVQCEPPPGPPREPPPEVKKMFEECEKEVGVSKESIRGPEHENEAKAKCFHACMMKKDGSLVDGKVNIEKAIEVSSKRPGPEAAADKVKAEVTECANKANEGKDECEVAGAFQKCFMEKRHHH